jgi:hypothetical protein
MFRGGPRESISCLAEGNPCVASALTATHCLVISRLGKGDQDHAYINLLPLDISLAYFP